MLRSFDGKKPQISDSSYVDPSAVIIGDVVIEADASVWPNATIRGDNGTIVVGTGANVQDGAVLHEDAILEPDSTVGHNGIVHGATVGEGAIVGMNAVVLDDVEVGEESIIAAGAVVVKDTEVPPATLMAGTPATPKTDLPDAEPRRTAKHYANLTRQYAETSHVIQDDNRSNGDASDPSRQ